MVNVCSFNFTRGPATLQDQPGYDDRGIFSDEV